jgi:sporulation integral membrane protein YtvI
MSIRAVIGIIVGLLLLYALFTVGFPFLLALIVAIFLEPLTLAIAKYGKTSRLISGSIISTMFTLITSALFYLIGFNIISQLVQFAQRVPDYYGGAQSYVEQLNTQTRLFYESLSPQVAQQLQGWVAQGVQQLGLLIQGISSYIVTAAVKVPNLLFIYIVFIMALYLFTFSLPTLRKSFLSLFEESSSLKMSTVLTEMRSAIFGFLYAQVVMGALTYIITFIGCLILRTEYPLAIALLVMVMEFVPIIGTGLVFLPWALFVYITGDTSHMIGIIVLFTILTLVRRIVEPKVLSDSVGISALSALISLYIGFELVGIIGLFLGPTVVILAKTLRRAGLLNMKIKLD